MTIINFPRRRPRRPIFCGWINDEWVVDFRRDDGSMERWVGRPVDRVEEELTEDCDAGRSTR